MKYFSSLVFFFSFLKLTFIFLYFLFLYIFFLIILNYFIYFSLFLYFFFIYSYFYFIEKTRKRAFTFHVALPEDELPAWYRSEICPLQDRHLGAALTLPDSRVPGNDGVGQRERGTLHQAGHPVPDSTVSFLHGELALVDQTPAMTDVVGVKVLDGLDTTVTGHGP